jgi:NAD(P)-dependent dehydrogenase (short-subunit alcohol dehydrogenase family)
MARVSNKSALIVGGSSGIGFATADAMLREGATVWIAGRTRSKLQVALAKLDADDRVQTLVLDMTDDRSVSNGLSQFAPDSLDMLVVTASSAVHGPFETLPIANAQAMFESKFWGPYRVAQQALPQLRDGGSITFFSGVLSRRPGVNCSGLGAVNAAVEGLTRGLALELGPRVRVNCISPGMVRTEAYAGLPEEKREAMYRDTGASLPVRRVGEPDEIADAVLFAATNPYLTGQVLDVDGGHMIRQYASR